MPILFDVTKDVLFRKGLAEGVEKGMAEEKKRKENITIINLLLQTDLENKIVATIAAAKLSRVLQLKKAVAATTLQKTIDQYKNTEELTKNQQSTKKKAMLPELLKIKDLDDKAIAEIAQAKVEEVKKLRSALAKQKSKKQNKKQG